MDISAAATVKTNIVNTCPTISPRCAENATKFKFTLSKISSNDIKIAIIPIGHADGISRSLGNGKVGFIINNKVAKTVGNICMDMLMIEIGNISCNEGDEVEIFGESNSANDFSKKNKTIPYELITSIGPRIKRVFLS